MPIFLEPHAEKRAPPDALPGVDTTKLLFHQVRTVLALREHELVVNTYNTGTGKTRAALLWLLERRMRKHSALIIAPTNALVGQHLADARAFVEAHGLPHEVLEVTAKSIRALPSPVPLRQGEKLQRLIANFREFLSDTDDLRRRPMVLVVNPDIFYYALFFQYQGLDQRNVFEQVFKTFRYIVVDEFHYYDSKQLVCFLFFCILSRELGYFSHEDRKLCLLSATPTTALRDFFDRIFGADNWAEVAPDNEPPESVAYPTAQTLAPVELEIGTAQLPEWVGQQLPLMREWRQQNLDIALISSSLRRVNEAFDLLAGLDPRRITGPEPEEARRVAGSSSLILATPTVDLGYNFDRPGKLRQPIDVVVFDARFHDEAIQRLGRAGRVLGREQTDRLSRAIMLLPEDAVLQLKRYDGQHFSRPAFNRLLRELDALPPKHSMSRYLGRYGVQEAFFPIYRLAKIWSPDEREAVLERLHNAVCEVLAPKGHQSKKSLSWLFCTYDHYGRMLDAAHKDTLFQEIKRSDLAEVVERLELWRKRLAQKQDLPPDHQQQLTQGARAVAERLQRRPDQLAQVLDFVRSQHALIKAMFNFRDSFQGVDAVLYDEQRLLSSEQFNRYDLLHLIANYELVVLADRKEFERTYGSPDFDISDGQLFVSLKRRRSPPTGIALALDNEQTRQLPQADFELRYTCRPVALTGLVLREQSDRETSRPLWAELARSISEQYVPTLIVPKRDSGHLYALASRSNLIVRDLEIAFDAGPVVYNAVLGTDALHVDSEIGWWLRNRPSRDNDSEEFLIL
ncbi:MAG: hypothetical protein OHK0022_49180 [Roseiflexaceae bacterium]